MTADRSPSVPDPHPPPTHTPLAALPVLVLDLETTGLDVARDRVIQIGALAMHGAAFEERPRIDQIIDPGIPIPESASRVHGLHDADVEGAPSFADFAQELRDALAGRVVVGHHVGFDLAVIRNEAARAGIEWTEPPSLDLAMLVGALDPTLPDVGLETVTSRLGVTIEGRHSAMGDCRASAEGFARLLPLLRDVDIRTLGEARAFAARRDDLTLRQARAGWHEAAGEAAAPPLAPALRLDGYTFERRLADVMSAPPEFIEPAASARAAARRMVERGIGALLVGRPDSPPAGIVTERDLLKLAARDPQALDRTPVTEVMSSPVAGMEADEMVYRALGRMDRLKLRHLAVTDSRRRAVGMVSQRDLLAHRARAVGSLGDALAAARTQAELAAAYGQVPRVAAGLVDEGLRGREIARVVSAELRALTGRCAEIAAAELRAEGRGPAPAPWCALVLGSGGRAESLLGADQDNALIHAGEPGDDDWFEALGAGMSQLLHVAGVPLCKGGVMAINAEWRGTHDQWRDRIAEWLRRARPEDLLNVDIFFDLTAVAGDRRLARELHTDAVASASHTPPFLNLMAQSVQSLAPRLGFLTRLPLEQGRCDLKRDGLLPLVSLARTLALRVGSTARATPDRLREAAIAGRLAEGDAERLVALHAELLDVVLGQQLRDLSDHVPPSSRVNLKELDRRRASSLVDGLKSLGHVVRDLQGLVAG